VRETLLTPQKKKRTELVASQRIDEPGAKCRCEHKRLMTLYQLVDVHRTTSFLRFDHENNHHQRDLLDVKSVQIELLQQDNQWGYCSR
jgi:hypothetical protein